MTSLASEEPVSRTTTNTKHQVKRKPVETADEVPLLKKLFRRKLSTCLQQFNTGKYRPKPTKASSEEEDDDRELGAPEPKKTRLEDGRWELKGEENSSTTRHDKGTNVW